MNSNSTAGVGSLARQFYQVWRALRDPSIPWAVKWLIPIAALVYWISPVDLIPFFPLDDIVVVLVALNVFMQMISRYQSTGPGEQGQRTAHNRHTNASATGRAASGNKTIETTWRVIEE
jgi:uncharacterized membrane protein YkvA (DUF1232 family)